MPQLKPRLERFVQSLALGQTQKEAALYAGFKVKDIDSYASRLCKKTQVQARLAEIIEHHRQRHLVTADDLHERWSQMHEADIADIIGFIVCLCKEEERKTCKRCFGAGKIQTYKPIHEWPKIWRQMLSGVDVKELFERSKDGGNSSWDKIGEVVKLKFVSVKELGELLGRHKAVDAFVAQKTQVDLTVNLSEELSAALAAGRERARLARGDEVQVIDVSPQPPKVGDQ